MKIKIIIAHISIPVIFAVVVFIYAIDRDSFSFDLLTSVLFGGGLFYAAPYILWAIIVSVGKLRNTVAHAGFSASTFSLALIAGVWFFPGDPSGLPMQWMLYWPLAFVLQIIVAGSVSAYIHFNVPKNDTEIGTKNSDA